MGVQVRTFCFQVSSDSRGMSCATFGNADTTGYPTVCVGEFAMQTPVCSSNASNSSYIAGLLQSPDPAKGEICGLALRYIRLVDTETLLRSQG